MNENAVDTILSQVQRKLNVASLNSFDETRLREDVIPDAAASLAPDLGMTLEEAASFDWAAPSRERTLLVNLCFYEFSHAAEQFAADFADDVAKCRDSRLATAYAEGSHEE